jgi:hypothetical protein
LIVLHPNLSEGLAEFHDFDSIKNRPLYAGGDVDSSKVTLSKPIGVYKFKEKVPCGLKSCRTLHGKGLVALTSEGTEVNIGHICGRNHFGEHFEVLWQQASRMESRKFHIGKVREFKAVAGRHEAQMKALMEAPKGAAWCSRAVRRLRTALPSDAVGALMELAKRGESRVYEEQEFKGERADIYRQFGIRSSHGSNYYDQQIHREYKGQLQGLTVLLNDPGNLLYRLQSEFAEFLKVDPVNCKGKEVRQAADFAAQFESRLKIVEDLLKAADRFFTPKNFALFIYLDRLQPSSKQALASFPWDFETGQLRSSSSRPKAA